MNDETIDIAAPVAEICQKLGLKPQYVSHIDFWPGHVAVHLYKGRDGRCKGPKYVDDDGNPAMETVQFKVWA